MITDDALGLNRAYQIGSGANLPLIFDLFLSLCQALKLQLTILFYFQVSDKGLVALSNYCSNLKELHVSSCYGVTDKGIVCLLQQCLSLTVLDVSWCFSVTDHSMKLLVSPECALNFLRITDCNKVSNE